MRPSQKQQPITSWSEDDRPREKMIAHGRQVLSDSELLAIILGSGSVGESAVELSKRILSDYDNNLHELGKATIHDFVSRYKGIGEAKAINIIAALELGRRRKDSEPKERITIQSSRDAYEIFRPHMIDLPHEEFWVMYTNTASRVIETIKLSSGIIDRALIDARSVLKRALEVNAKNIILCHNHPSGAVQPSAQDIHVTQTIQQACLIFNINLADHIIIGDDKYFSFNDRGIINKD
jgi:DNA repair protein RadC